MLLRLPIIELVAVVLAEKVVTVEEPLLTAPV